MAVDEGVEHHHLVQDLILVHDLLLLGETLKQHLVWRIRLTEPWHARTSAVLFVLSVGVEEADIFDVNPFLEVGDLVYLLAEVPGFAIG